MAAEKTVPKQGAQRRSPNFPAISLPKAIKRTESIYKEDGTTAISSKVLLQHLGFGERLTGASGRVVAALRQYGLIQRTGGDKYQVSNDAYHIFELSKDAPKRKQSIDACARKPAMISEVLAEYPKRLPSDSTLKDFLITEKRFNPVSAENFIQALTETLGFAEVYERANSEGANGAAEDDVLPDGNTLQHQTGDIVQSHPNLPPVPSPAGTAREVSSLPEGEAILQWPAKLSREGAQDLDEWLTMLHKKLKRRYDLEDSI